MKKAMLVPVLAATIAVMQPGPAAAGEGDIRSATVSTWMLDLSTTQGIDLLVYRLHDAIGRMCDDDWQCREEAWDSADAQAARAIEHDMWRRRIAVERQADWRRYGARRFRQGPQVFVPGRKVESVTKQTEITTTRTTRTQYRITYRDIPPDVDWAPR